MTADDKELRARALAAMIRQARKGDRSAARGLIADFAELATDPHCFAAVGGVPPALLQYIATCLAKWQKYEFKDAETWFHVVPEAHRPDATTGQHVTAMRAYLLLRARAKGNEAARAGAAVYSGLTETQVQYIVEKDKAEQPGWFDGRAIGELTFAALQGINRRLHHRVLNPPRKKYQRSH